METYPNIDLRIVQSSFGELRTRLISGKLDVILTLCFDVRDLDGITWVNYAEDRSVLAVSCRFAVPGLHRGTAMTMPTRLPRRHCLKLFIIR